jgi:hypothetical protein
MGMNYNPTTAASVAANGQKILLPMIRKVMPTIMAQQIVGVQPMTNNLGIFNRLLYKNFNKKYWPYQYFIDDKTYRISDVERWCWDQFKGRYWNNYGRNFVFKREKDAVMFALRWL